MRNIRKGGTAGPWTIIVSKKSFDEDYIQFQECVYGLYSLLSDE